MRLGIYCDYSYRVEDGRVYAQRPFSLFVRGLARHFDRLVVTGRLDPSPGRYPYLMDGLIYVPLPHYARASHLRTVIRSIPGGVRSFWRMLDDVDIVWILGPSPAQAVVFALLTMLRRRRLVLGVRQNLPVLVRHRHPGKPAVIFAAVALESAFRLLACVVPVVVVGTDLARRYRRAKSLHVSYISMLSEDDILAADADKRTYDGPELRLLSVGRLDPEKNPLLMADVLERARRNDPRWRLDVCGDGSLAGALAQRLEDLGVADRATLHGYVPIDDGLWDFYARSHALLHISLSEGMPQVLLEAFAARLPVVATAVGGVPDVVRDRGWLVPPGDADAPATALDELISNPELRAELVERAVEHVRRHTLEAECASVAGFLSGGQVKGTRAKD